MKFSKHLVITALTAASPSAVFAASTAAPTGVSAGFFQMFQDWSAALSGDLGALILLFGTIGAAMMAIIAQRFTMALMTFGAAFLIGYGVTIFTSSAGVTANIDMVEWAPVDETLNADHPTPSQLQL